MQISDPTTRLASLLACLAPTLCACSGGPDPATQPVEPAPVVAPTPAVAPAAGEEEDEDEITGKSLYQRHCAGCHNDNGDGRGATILAQGKEARSFAQGGFAFGNTPEAIYNTISSGIPGSSLMQPFSAVMDEDERRMVAEYVLTLTPYGNPVLAAGSILVVKDRAEFARGKLPALREGLPEHPRGLMVGLPGGASFQYRVDDVRLIAMRRGGFVDRTDWNERGGGVLKPLGEIAYEVGAGDPQPWLFAMVDGRPVPVELELTATRTTGSAGQEAQVESRPRAASPRGLRRVVETLFQPELSEPGSFGLRLVFDRAVGAQDFAVRLLSWPEDSPVVDGELFVSPSQPGHQILWKVLGRDQGFDCIRIECQGPAGLRSEPTAAMCWSMGSSETPISLSLVVLHVKAWDFDLLARVDKEIAR